MGSDAAYWIEKLGLSAHPEGGYWAQTYRSNEWILKECLPERFKAARRISSAIYYLLKSDQISALHRIKSDELWHFYAGSSLTIYAIDSMGELSRTRLGNNPEAGDSFQALVKAGCWFGAKVNVSESYSLVGCTVSPGFDYDDFEIANRCDLLARYPRHRSIIEELTK